MIKTKYLETTRSKFVFEEIDDLINDFIEKNPNIEIIDIKYQSNISAVDSNGIGVKYIYNSALIIYKEGETK